MTHIVHEVPAVAKSIAIWTLGLLHLLCLAEYPAPTFNTTIWQRRLLQVGVSWRTYTYPFFQHASVVYIKMPFHAPRRTTYVQSGRFYIGSTGIGVCKREFNRAAKLKQVHQMQSAHVELAIRYWSQFRNYSSFIMIVINHHPTYRLAWIQEHALLSYFQAPLNFPYITRILQFKSTGMIIQSTRKKIIPSVSLGQRLFLRLRRRLRTLGSIPDTHAFLYQAWATIFDLASDTKRSYDAARTIRSGAVHGWEVYALFRLCKHLEEPQRSKVKHIITAASKFRNLTVPQVNNPFTIPFLAHSDFSSRLQLWLRSYVLTYKEMAIPLHPPPQAVRESSFPTLRSFLHNHRRVENRWDVFNIPSLPCCCSQLAALRNPAVAAVQEDGHCCLSLDEMKLPPHLEHFRN